jgi:hypothetical protein
MWRGNDIAFGKRESQANGIIYMGSRRGFPPRSFRTNNHVGSCRRDFNANSSSLLRDRQGGKRIFCFIVCPILTFIGIIDQIAYTRHALTQTHMLSTATSVSFCSLSQPAVL